MEGTGQERHNRNQVKEGHATKVKERNARKGKAGQAIMRGHERNEYEWKERTRAERK